MRQETFIPTALSILIALPASLHPPPGHRVPGGVVAIPVTQEGDRHLP